MAAKRPSKIQPRTRSVFRLLSRFRRILSGSSEHKTVERLWNVKDFVLSESSYDDAKNIAHFYLSLLNDWEWVSRRVETIHLLDEEHRERRVSLDIDVAELRRRASQYSLSDMEVLPIPLAFVRKGLMLDFDAVDSSGSSISIFNSREDSKMAQFAMLAAMRSSSQFCESEIDAVSGLLRDVAESFPPLDQLDNTLVTGEWIVPAYSKSWESAKEVWEKIENLELTDDRSAEYLIHYLARQYTTNYSPTVWFPMSGSTEIIKYKRLENEHDSLISILKSPDLDISRSDKDVSQAVSFRISNVGLAAREHIRLVAPTGTFLGSAVIRPWVTSDRHDILKYRARLSLRRAVFYTAGAGRSRHNYYVYAHLNPDLSGFATPAKILCGLIVAILSLGGMSIALPAEVLQVVARQSDAVITLMLIVPTLTLAYVVRDDEHAYRRKLLRPARRIVLISFLPLLAAAFCLLAFGVEHPRVTAHVWLLCAAFAFLGLRLLRRSFQVVETIEGAIRSASAVTAVLLADFDRGSRSVEESPREDGDVTAVLKLIWEIGWRWALKAFLVTAAIVIISFLLPGAYAALLGSQPSGMVFWEPFPQSLIGVAVVFLAAAIGTRPLQLELAPVPVDAASEDVGTP